MVDSLAGLNADQLSAVLYWGGPLIIVAGPGSGKTRVITHRIAHRIAVDGIAPRRLLGLTFTNRAAGEMQQRIDTLVGPDAAIRLGTFHSVCSALLRRHAHRIGYRRDFRLLSPRESRAMLRSIVESFPSGSPAPMTAVAGAIAAVKNGRSVAHAARRHHMAPDSLSSLLAAYQARLRSAGSLDLDDLQHVAATLLASDEEVRALCRSGFDEILVDEYQDTNPIQQELLRLLWPLSGALTVVGDEDQSIYGWRQASAGTVERFKEQYPRAAVVTLHETYRSTKHILRAATSLIAHNTDRVEKHLRTSKPAGALPQCYAAADERDEADWIAAEIERLVSRNAAAYRDIAILYRINAQSRALEDALIGRKIPYHVLGSQRFYQRREIQAVVAYLRLALDEDDEAAAFLLATVPGVGERRLEAVRSAAAEAHASLLDIMVTSGLPLPGPVARRVACLHRRMESVARHRQEALGRVVEAGIAAVMEDVEAGALDADGAWETLDELRSVAQEFQSRRGTLRDFVDRLAMGADRDGREPGVALLSLHAAKGLEYPVVFLSGVEEGMLPYRRALERGDDLAEERRLCYVGITRAESLLYLSYAHVRLAAGQAMVGGASRFLAEMGVSNMTLLSSPQLSPRPRLTRVHPGDRVSHPRWLLGSVVAVEGNARDTMVTVDFDRFGRQRLQLCHAPLTAVAKEDQRVRAR